MEFPLKDVALLCKMNMLGSVAQVGRGISTCLRSGPSPPQAAGPLRTGVCPAGSVGQGPGAWAAATPGSAWAPALLGSGPAPGPGSPGLHGAAHFPPRGPAASTGRKGRGGAPRGSPRGRAAARGPWQRPNGDTAAPVVHFTGQKHPWGGGEGRTEVTGGRRALKPS